MSRPVLAEEKSTFASASIGPVRLSKQSFLLKLARVISNVRDGSSTSAPYAVGTRRNATFREASRFVSSVAVALVVRRLLSDSSAGTMTLPCSRSRLALATGDIRLRHARFCSFSTFFFSSLLRRLSTRRRTKRRFEFFALWWVADKYELQTGAVSV